MHRILRTMRIALLAAAGAAAFVVTPHGQSILGAPSEANHFIATPKGWVHPKTPWGEPDIQANLNMMQAAGVPLERCANAMRFGGPPCDMHKAWWTEEEHKQRIATASGRGDPGRQLIEKGEYGRAFLSGVTDPSTPQRQTTLIVDPPRTGMSREALEGVVGLGASRIVYISCDVATLARDLRRLVDAGYGMGPVDAFDLFPNTPHIETVVVFNR